MDEVTLPAPPEGCEYRLMKKRPRQTVKMNDRDHSELSPKQLAALKYREKNKKKLTEYNRQYQQKIKEEEKQ